MATGNDEGEPGEQSHAPLTADEQALLHELGTPDDIPAAPAVEDSPQVAAAVDDDAPLAVGGDVGDQGDELAPEFTDR